MDDIANALTLEIKREIATRYFGFRRWFEDESAAYGELLAASREKQQQQFATAAEALAAIKALLATAPLYQSFLETAGLASCEPSLSSHYPPPKEATTRPLEALRKGLPLGRRKRHRRLVLAAYQGLHQALSEALELHQELVASYELLLEEEKSFSRNNDINTILDFIRGLDVMESSRQSLQGGPQPGQAERLTGGLQLRLPAAPTTAVPLPSELPSPQALQPRVVALAKQGYQALHRNS